MGQDTLFCASDWGEAIALDVEIERVGTLHERHIGDLADLSDEKSLVVVFAPAMMDDDEEC